MHRAAGSTSTKTRMAPTASITAAVAGNVIVTVITSSPRPIPSAARAMDSACVPGRDADGVTYADICRKLRLESCMMRAFLPARPERNSAQGSDFVACGRSGHGADIGNRSLLTHFGHRVMRLAAMHNAAVPGQVRPKSFAFLPDVTIGRAGACRTVPLTEFGQRANGRGSS
jgi:hypothetical protein